MLNIEIIIELLILIGLIVCIYLYFFKPKDSSIDEIKFKLELEAKLVESLARVSILQKMIFLNWPMKNLKIKVKLLR